MPKGNTSETVLYRKYRPAAFVDVRGQEHIVGVLEGAIQNGAIAHAYLFSGSRGTGKTSIARIFASAIGTSERDLYEIDAASNRGIDDIRELRDAVSILPFESKYKVYVVDEAHMLTKEAFNALLKTLEEPPAHVVFILATTELEKLPETIQSRCQIFSFKKPSLAVVREMARDVGKKEGIEMEPDAADLIALLADGSFRDAHGILQKLLGKGTKGKVTAEDVSLVSGAPQVSVIRDILLGLKAHSSEKALCAIRDAAKHNTDMKVLLKMLLHRVRIILLLRHAPNMKKELEEQVGEDEMKLLEEMSAEKDSLITSASLLRLLEAYDAVGRAYIPELPIELALIDIAGGKEKE